MSGPVSGRDPSGQALVASHGAASVSTLSGFDPSRDWRPSFEARPVLGREWLWDVWDIEHPAECNHFPILRVNSRGAADDLHREIAKVCADALNSRFAMHNSHARYEEAIAIEAATAGETAQHGSTEGESAGRQASPTPNQTRHP